MYELARDSGSSTLYFASASPARPVKGIGPGRSRKEVADIAGQTAAVYRAGQWVGERLL